MHHFGAFWNWRCYSGIQQPSARERGKCAAKPAHQLPIAAVPVSANSVSRPSAQSTWASGDRRSSTGASSARM